MSKLIVANWKSNKTLAQTQEWLKAFQQAEKKSGYEYVICPPFPFIPVVSETAQQTKAFQVGIQDISPFEAGAYTGAVSAQNLEGFSVKYVILGHSERRKYFHETNQDIARKVESALTAGITPIVCMDQADIEPLANELDRSWHTQIIPTYEPVDAISTFGGHEHSIQEVIATIEEMRRLFRAKRVLYGGSVNPENALTYLQPTEIDGALVGGASLSVEEFIKI